VRLDFLDPEAPEGSTRCSAGGPTVVLSDMAANATGHRPTTTSRSSRWSRRRPPLPAMCWRRRRLPRQGVARRTEHRLLAELKRDFASVKHVEASRERADSAELYLLATGFRKDKLIHARRPDTSAERNRAARWQRRALDRDAVPE